MDVGKLDLGRFKGIRSYGIQREVELAVQIMQLKRLRMFFELCTVFLRKLGEIFEIETTFGIDTLM